MTDAAPATPVSRRARPGLWLPLIAVAAIALGGWYGWTHWQSRQARTSADEQAALQRIAALEQRVDALRQTQRTQAQRIQDAVTTHRILRDEVLALGQRGALLEETVARLSDSDRHGAQALRLDEVELLLSLAAQRLAIAGDADGARRAYALAADTLEGIDDHRLLNLRQALAQERDAVEALGAGPQATLAARLDRFADALARLPRVDAATPSARPTWQRVLAPLVEVRPTRAGSPLGPADRQAAEAAMHIDLALARAALERGDGDGLHAALARVDAWLPRLWPDSPALRQGRAELRQLRELPLEIDSPLIGSTLRQLHEIRRTGAPARRPPSQPLVEAP